MQQLSRKCLLFNQSFIPLQFFHVLNAPYFGAGAHRVPEELIPLARPHAHCKACPQSLADF